MKTFEELIKRHCKKYADSDLENIGNGSNGAIYKAKKPNGEVIVTINIKVNYLFKKLGLTKFRRKSGS
jgi:hypothetical protein